MKQSKKVVDDDEAALEQGNAMCKEMKLCSSSRRSMTT